MLCEKDPDDPHEIPMYNHLRQSSIISYSKHHVTSLSTLFLQLAVYLSLTHSYRLAPDIAMTDFDGKRIDVEQDVEVGKKVGQGAFATVFAATFKKYTRLSLTHTLQ